MAEIEHFVNPDKRQTFNKFSKVADLQLAFYSACNQMEGKPPQLMRLGDAVKSVSSILVNLCSALLLHGEGKFCRNTVVKISLVIMQLL